MYLDRVEWTKTEKIQDNQEENRAEETAEVQGEEDRPEETAGVQEKEEEVNLSLLPAKEYRKPESIKAKQNELEAFAKFNVYKEVKDIRQERLSSRWVLTDKSTQDQKKVKAQLVCRGFEELVKVQSDSPTGSRETLHMLLTVAALKEWKIKSGDVKNGYLQGEMLDKEVYMEPPLEAKKPDNMEVEESSIRDEQCRQKVRRESIISVTVG